MSRAAVVVVLVLASTAAADGDHVSGFVTYGAGQLRGRVLDNDDKPLDGERVHVVSSTGAEQVVATDRDGRFRAELRGGNYTMVFIQADGHISGEVTLPQVAGKSEVVEIHETIPPAVLAVPRSNPAAVLEYSDTAIEHDAWVRAWLMLDIDETGAVTRIKLLKRPGYDLDPIATREAFKLRFEPARDRANRPVRTLVVWAFEWPSYWWLKRHNTLMTKLPPDIGSVRCKGSGPSHAANRDCSTPDLGAALREPWLTR